MIVRDLLVFREQVLISRNHGDKHYSYRGSNWKIFPPSSLENLGLRPRFFLGSREGKSFQFSPSVGNYYYATNEIVHLKQTFQSTTD